MPRKNELRRRRFVRAQFPSSMVDVIGGAFVVWTATPKFAWYAVLANQSRTPPDLAWLV